MLLSDAFPLNGGQTFDLKHSFVFIISVYTRETGWSMWAFLCYRVHVDIRGQIYVDNFLPPFMGYGHGRHVDMYSKCLYLLYAFILLMLIYSSNTAIIVVYIAA